MPFDILEEYENSTVYIVAKSSRANPAPAAMSKNLTRDKIVKEIKTTKQFRRAVRYRGLTSTRTPRSQTFIILALTPVLSLVMEVYTSYWGPCQCVFNTTLGDGQSARSMARSMALAEGVSTSATTFVSGHLTANP